MKKISLIFTILCLVLFGVFFTGCVKSKPETGYDIWKKTYKSQMKDANVDDVDFNYCEYVKIEDGDEDVYYYHAFYTVYVLNTDTESDTYFRWVQGGSVVLQSTEAVYQLAYDAVINNEMEGICGRITDKK